MRLCICGKYKFGGAVGKEMNKGLIPRPCLDRGLQQLMTFLSGPCSDSAFLSHSTLNLLRLSPLWYTSLWLIATGILDVQTLSPQISFDQMPLEPPPGVRRCHWPSLDKQPDTFPRKEMSMAILHGEGTTFTVFGCLQVIKSKGKFVHKCSLFLCMFWPILYLFIHFFIFEKLVPNGEIHLNASYRIDWNAFEYSIEMLVTESVAGWYLESA